MTTEEVSVYLELISRGEGTPLSISRHSGINRTKVYRILEGMEKQKLIVQEIGDNTTRVSPAPIHQLQEILRKKQTRVAELTNDWNQATQMLEQLAAEQKSETKVKFYHGKSGIEQMVWNVLRTKSEVVGYTFRDLSHFVGEKFMREFSAEFKRRNLKMRDIYGDEYKSSEPIDNDWGKNVESRYLPKSILSIPHQTDIYDGVVSFYSWSGEEVWGSEIYNEKVAIMQKQLFELAWEKAEKTK
jgi:sugar-specific transcriptional regulator TrmB